MSVIRKLGDVALTRARLAAQRARLLRTEEDRRNGERRTAILVDIVNRRSGLDRRYYAMPLEEPHQPVAVHRTITSGEARILVVTDGSISGNKIRNTLTKRNYHSLSSIKLKRNPADVLPGNTTDVSPDIIIFTVASNQTLELLINVYKQCGWRSHTLVFCNDSTDPIFRDKLARAADLVLDPSMLKRPGDLVTAINRAFVVASKASAELALGMVVENKGPLQQMVS